MRSRLRMAAMCVASMLAVAPAKAATVCVLIAESGLPVGAGYVEAASAWEAGLMDAFFEAGHIVTSAPRARWDESFRKADFAITAKDGGADYLAIAFLEFPAREGADPSLRPSPAGVTFTLIDLRSGGVVSEGADTALPKTVSGAEEVREAEKVARTMLKGLKER